MEWYEMVLGLLLLILSNKGFWYGILLLFIRWFLKRLIKEAVREVLNERSKPESTRGTGNVNGFEWGEVLNEPSKPVEPKTWTMLGLEGNLHEGFVEKPKT